MKTTYDPGAGGTVDHNPDRGGIDMSLSYVIDIALEEVGASTLNKEEEEVTI